jgi:hypothetical protein
MLRALSCTDMDKNRFDWIVGDFGLPKHATLAAYFLFVPKLQQNCNLCIPMSNVLAVLITLPSVGVAIRTAVELFRCFEGWLILIGISVIQYAHSF